MNLQRRELSQGMQGQDVLPFKVALTLLELLAKANVTEWDVFDAAMAAAVTSLQQANNLPATGVVDAQTARVIGARLAGVSQRAVVGTVLDTGQQPAVDLLVRAFYPHVGRQDEGLGESGLDGRGNYVIFYAPSPDRRADLLVRLYDAGANEIAASGIHCDVSPVQVIPFTLSQEQYRGSSEYERHIKLLTALLDNVTLSDLDDEALSRLDCKTDIPLEQLRHLRQDAIYAQKHAVKQGVFYGLLRQDLNDDDDRLLALKFSHLAAALDQAIAQNFVSSSLRSELKKLKNVAVQIALPAANYPGTKLGQVLALSPLDEEQQQTAVRFILDYDEKADSFWEKLSGQTGFDEASAQNLRFTFHSAALVNNHLPAIQAIEQVKQDLQAQTTRELTRLTASDWQQTLEQNQVPLPSDFEDQAQYAAWLEKRVESFYPTDALFYRLEKTAESLPIAEGSPLFRLYRHLKLEDIYADASLSETEKVTAVRKRIQWLDVFRQNNFGFEVGAADLIYDRRYEEGKSTNLNWEGIPEDEVKGIREQLRAFQRVEWLAPNASSRQALLVGGYDHSSVILDTPEGKFISDTGLEPHIAKEIRGRASDRATHSEVAYWGVHDAATGVKFNVDNSDTEIAHALRELAGLDELFGVESYCDCPHCQSVLSPAAYFVDLMRFIERNISNHANGFGETGGDRRKESPLYLPTRRPDLWDLELSCENTHNLIPYLDVVNHVLERFLIGRLTVTDVDGLYVHFSALRDSFQQPFVLPLAEMRLYLAHFNLQRTDILRALQADEDAIHREYLHLTQDEFNLLTTNAPATYIYSLYEITPEMEDPSGAIAIPVPQFLRVTGLTRAQLDLFMHPDLTAPPALPSLPIYALLQKEEVAGSLGHQFVEKLTQLRIGELDLIHRFIRLWHKTLWTLPEYDLVLETLTLAGLGTIIDANLIYHLADVILLQEQLGLTVEEVVSLYHNMPARSVYEGRESLYLRLFGTEPFATEPVLFHDGTSETATISVPPIHVPRLLAGLGLSESELLDLLLALRPDLDLSTSGSDQEMAVTQANLSLLFRHALLARKLRLTISQLFLAVHLTFGEDHQALTSLAEIQQFVEALNRYRQLPFSLAELGLIVLAEGRNAAYFQITTPQIGELHVRLPEMDDAALLQALADLFRWTQAEASLMVGLASMTVEDIQTATVETLSEQLHTLERLNLVRERLAFAEADLRFIQAHNTIFSFSAELSVQGVENLVTYSQLVETTNGNVEEVQNMIVDYESSGSFTAAGMAALAAVWESDLRLLESLLGILPSPLHPLTAVRQLADALALAAKLGLNGASLAQMADDASFAALMAGRDAIQGALAAKYPDEAKRNEMLEPIQDRMRGWKRDALVDYLLSPAFAGGSWTEPNSLYHYFLIDTEMDDCARTSWVLAGISSLQLYVQRCLLNLEVSAEGEDPEVHVRLPEEAIEQWTWRKKYRVWEANRKVFLWPENYLNSDNRDNKTPFFAELEDELLQQQVTQESVEGAYKTYTDKFLRVANLKMAGAYRDEQNRVLYIFGFTPEDPLQYHYRTFSYDCISDPLKGIWSPWYPVDLAINAEVVSPILYRGKLYLFWVEITTRSQSIFEGGNSVLEGFVHSIKLNYASCSPSNRWSPASRFLIREVFDRKLSDYERGETPVFQLRPSDDLPDIHIEGPQKETYSLTGLHWDRIYPYQYNKKLFTPLISSRNIDGSLFPRSIFYEVQLFDKTVQLHSPLSAGNLSLKSLYSPASEGGHSLYEANSNIPNRLSPYYFKTYNVHYYSERIPTSRELLIGSVLSKPIILPVNSQSSDYLITIDGASFIFNRITSGSESLYTAQRLGTFNAKSLAQLLYEEGLEDFLSVETQQSQKEPELGWIDPTEANVQLLQETKHIDLNGAAGNYYRELYFYIPFLLAEQLNAQQQFAEAQRWFHYIFDPTAPEEEDLANPLDRVWRYIMLRDIGLPTLAEILTDSAAIRQYEKDPFNPHAIARLRLSAYQKAVAMKYVDNLLDWGDYLFAQDTYESINEAALLYVLAQDILGPRPEKRGSCSVGISVTYREIVDNWDADESDFLLFVENLTITADFDDRIYTSSGGEFLDYGLDRGIILGSGEDGAPTIEYVPAPATPGVARETSECSSSTYTSDFIRGMRRLAFCVPANEEMLSYWDRVEDRLFKIRHCMNISGVRRALALFEPPIDPNLLVRAKAAGLTLEQVFDMAAFRPPYRFSFILERAKSFAASTQNLGTALLSALENKDVEELTLIRATHEHNILKMTTRIKEKQLQEAQRQKKSLEEGRKNVENRIDHYTELIQTNLTEWETVEQVVQHLASKYHIIESIHEVVAGVFHTIPEVGSPFSMKFGGKQVGDSYEAVARSFRAIAESHSAIATSTELEARNQRRMQEWQFQLVLAMQELKQIEQQILAADLRVEIAEQDLKIHNKSLEQNQEQFDFMEDKFTKLGLYTWLATHLSRLYRQAYNLVYAMARQAQVAYQFERDDDTTFIEATSSYWTQDKAGFLAGEYLLQQLQQLELAYFTENKRDLEITKHVSLLQINPVELIRLREEGICHIHLPEVLFDLDFPGHYRRRIKSISLTIPCVTGPYTSVSAKLTLLNHRIRRVPGFEPLVIDPLTSQTSIATSSAQNDSGLFEFSFRDERYLPFEGEGVVSSWELNLPEIFRAFDYDMISDVIMHINYTATDGSASLVDDGETLKGFGEAVKGKLQNNINVWMADLVESGTQLSRLFSLRHEFPNEWHRLLHPVDDAAPQIATLSLTKSRFPYPFQSQEINISSFTLLVKINSEYAITYTTSTLQLSLEAGATASSTALDLSEWSGLLKAEKATADSPGDWSLAIGNDPSGSHIFERVEAEAIEDIFLVCHYSI